MLTLLTRCLSDQGGESYEAIAASLARDLLGARPNKIEPRPDPVFAVIEEARRLWKAHDALFRARTVGNPSEVEDEAHDAMWAYARGPLLETVPTTAGGCKALARFVNEYIADQGVPLWEGDGGADPILALIARSPLL